MQPESTVGKALHDRPDAVDKLRLLGLREVGSLQISEVFPIVRAHGEAKTILSAVQQGTAATEQVDGECIEMRSVPRSGWKAGSPESRSPYD